MEPGSTVTYTLVATNTGDATATNVSITDSAPPGTTFVGGTTTTTAGTIVSGDDVADTSLQVDLASLGPRVRPTRSRSRSMSWSTSRSLAGQTELSNQALFTSDETVDIDSDDPDVDPGPGDQDPTPTLPWSRRRCSR